MLRDGGCTRTRTLDPLIKSQVADSLAGCAIDPATRARAREHRGHVDLDDQARSSRRSVEQKSQVAAYVTRETRWAKRCSTFDGRPLVQAQSIPGCTARERCIEAPFHQHGIQASDDQLKRLGVRWTRTRIMRPCGLQGLGRAVWMRQIPAHRLDASCKREDHDRYPRSGRIGNWPTRSAAAASRSSGSAWPDAVSGGGLRRHCRP